MYFCQNFGKSRGTRELDLQQERQDVRNFPPMSFLAEKFVFCWPMIIIRTKL